MKNDSVVKSKVIKDINILKTKILYNMDTEKNEEKKIHWKIIWDELILFKQVFILINVHNDLTSREKILDLFQEKSCTIIESYNISMGIKEANKNITKNTFQKVADIILGDTTTEEEIYISDFAE